MSPVMCDFLHMTMLLLRTTAEISTHSSGGHMATSLVTSFALIVVFFLEHLDGFGLVCIKWMIASSSVEVDDPVLVLASDSSRTLCGNKY